MDATDFGPIYQRYAADVLRFALFLCGNRADAEDILSEMFMRAWTSPADIRVGTVTAYPLMIARNLHLDRVRVAGRTAALDIDSPDSAPGPETAAIDRDEVRARRGSSTSCRSIVRGATRCEPRRRGPCEDEPELTA